ncbi:hypothetical protein DFP73DRAFT_454990, partial [Morchella snyderi]
TPDYDPPAVAAGYTLQLVDKSIVTPRHIAFDDRGNLIVAGDRSGIVALVLEEGEGGCVRVARKAVVAEPGGRDLYHGVAVSADGRTIFASSTTTVYAFPYNSTTLSTLPPTTLITNLTNPGHITRTLYTPPTHPHTLLVSRGSASNFDPGSGDITTGRSQLKAFSTLAANQDFTASGTLLGWGLRNSVGVAQDPAGGIWSVENGPDSIVLEGVDVNERNPAEELNYHGLLATALDTPGYVGPSYGYPTCVTVWDPTALPPPYNTLFPSGAPLPLPPLPATPASCRNTTAAVLPFDAHTAPLDIKFHPALGGAFITFHGSSARAEPAGYSVAWLPFTPEGGGGQRPTGEVQEVVWTPNRTRCPEECLRPVGLAVDRRGRVWFTGDRGGEVWVVT